MTREQASKLPGKRVILGAREITADEVDAEAKKLASWLSSIGIGESDVVALLMWNDIPYLSLADACGRIGAYLVPLNWHLTRPELAYILEDSSAKVLFGHTHLLANVEITSTSACRVVAKPTPSEVLSAFPRVAADIAVMEGWTPWDEVQRAPDLAFNGPSQGNRGSIFYTSGTTGKPKGVVRAPMPDDIWRAARQRSMVAFGLDTARQGMCTIVTGPLYHSAPNAHALMCWALGLDVLMMSRFDAQAFLDQTQAHGVTHAHLVPTMFNRLLELPAAARKAFDPSSLVAVCHGAAPCPPAIKRQMIDWFGPVIREYYAGTETGGIVGSTSQDWLAHPGTIGKAMSGVDIHIVDDRDIEVAPGVNGRLLVRTATTTRFHYHGRGAPPPIAGWDGYVWLGDIGYVTADGYIFLTDRSSDIVISGGVNIYPAEVEQELAAIQGVGDCSVFGVPAPDLGEGIVAVVQRSPGATLTEASIVAVLSERLAQFKLPRRVIFVADLPREASGKIRKRLLKDQYQDLLLQEDAHG